MTKEKKEKKFNQPEYYGYKIDDSMSGREIMEAKRKAFYKHWPHYKKWAVDFKYRWWKKEDKPKVPDFSGTGSLFKWPAIHHTGRLTVGDTVIAVNPEDRMKLISNTWRNCFFMQWLVMQEELGKEKAAEMIGYMWLAMVPAMEGLTDRYIPGTPRDCVMLSKQFQIDCFYECIDIDVVEERPEKFVVRVLCAYWADWMHRWKQKGIDIRYGLCDLGCAQWEEEFAYKINPDIIATRTKWPVEGDPYCEKVFELKPKK